MKTIVTHFSVDFDATAAYWLVKKYLPGWKDTKAIFVAAGETLNEKSPDIDPNIIHLDTGFGRFDHHQTNLSTCAAKLVFKFLLKESYIPEKNILALERLVNFVNQIDHFEEVYFAQPEADCYDFCLYQTIEGLKHKLKDDIKVLEIAVILFDATLNMLINKIKAEEEIKQAYVFQSYWGKSLALESKNEEAMKLAMKTGFNLVIRHDPSRNFVRIKTLPSKKNDLTILYDKLISIDKKATWFLHISKNMLLNGSSKNPKAVPTKLTLPQVIEIIKKL